jgi:predicted 3-demethylubiquinone-9 3-methyltransferase (glyoxalase superfamily)
MQKITPCLWFNNNAEEAVKFYKSVFRQGKILKVGRGSEEASKKSGRPKGSVLTIEFELKGQKFLALNGGPVFTFNEAISLMVDCKGQREVDYFWEKLSQGGQKSRCGWLKDKFGVSWQVVPDALGRMMSGADGEKSGRVMQALMQMDKIDIGKLQEAYNGGRKTAKTVKR